jgi:long-chain fatty acid transport protein
MQSALRKSIIALSIGLAVGLAPTAYATNGLAPTGIGQEQKAMGGTAAGNPSNTMSMATNPAAAAFINDGYDVGLEVFQPKRSATLGATTFDGNGKSSFLIPEAGYKRKLNDKVDVGAVVYGNGGMNTQYSVNPGFGAGKAGIDYQQMYISPTASYKFNDRVAIGASANFIYHKFKAEGLSGFGIGNNGYDSSTGWGATVGVQGKVTDKLSAGLSYRTKVNPGKLEKYNTLLANGGEMGVPAATTAGIAYQATPKTLVAADVQRIYYKDVAAIGNPADPTLFPSNQMGFGWNNQTVYKIGVKHQATPKTAVMAGYNHGKSPLQSEDTMLGVLAPGVVEDHLSLGVQAKLSPKSKLTATYMHAFENEVKGNPYSVKMDQNSVGIAYSREF